MRTQRQNQQQTQKRKAQIQLVATLLLSLYLTGCSRGLQFGDPTSPDYSRSPYHGTGTVTMVIGSLVYVDWGENKSPDHYGMTLVVVRDKSLVAKFKCGGGGGGKHQDYYGCPLIEGSAKKGDTVLGIQHQREYKKGY